MAGSSGEAERNRAEEDFHRAYGGGARSMGPPGQRAFRPVRYGDGDEHGHGDPRVLSSNGFRARADMIKEALVAARLSREAHDTVAAIIKLAKRWSEERNALAHRLLSLDMRPGSLSACQYILIPGTARWRAAGSQLKGDITVAHMRIMRTSFLALQGIVHGLMLGQDQPFEWPPAEQLKSIRGEVQPLPIPAHSTAARPIHE